MPPFAAAMFLFVVFRCLITMPLISALSRMMPLCLIDYFTIAADADARFSRFAFMIPV